MYNKDNRIPPRAKAPGLPAGNREKHEAQILPGALQEKEFVMERTLIKSPIDGLVTLLSGRGPFSTIVMVSPVEGEPFQTNECGEYDVLVTDNDWVNKEDSLVEVGKYYNELEQIFPTVEVKVDDLEIRKSSHTACVEMTHFPTGRIVGAFHKPTQQENFDYCINCIKGILAEEKWKETYGITKTSIL